MAKTRFPHVADGAVTIGLVTDLDGFLALRQDWDALFARAALPQQVFQSHVFLRHWATHYLDRHGTLSIVTARRHGRLVMVWPLVRQRRCSLDTLRFMGIPVAQFGDVLVEDEDSEALLQAGWRAVLLLHGDLFEARKLRTDSVLARAGLLDEATRTEQVEAPFADLAWRVGEKGPSLAYPSRERSNHRRRLRRLEERGVVGFQTPPPGPEASLLASAAVAMKQASLARHGIIAPTVDDPRFSAFFRDLAGDAGGTSLRISSIHCNGVPVGIDLSLDCKGRSFGHVIATHPDHERGGVGKILVHHAFASARARGNTIFDLLAPADAYKLEHSDGRVGVSDLLLPLSLKGRLVCGLGIQHWRPALKSAAKRLPPGIARRVAAWNKGEGAQNGL
ncbi:GNAT family N-acetyltransferase [Bosea caraganae]|uniref:GNAT family N-acetyltransferase n=1 Tax=Bosea caraganae TaxID=2763117 RepID=A0A370KZX8_9HYPH|nr:GNAT family N-acetyltransferase [Bosea caraganae]RDJ20570.1 GNAT family N-acetyltransferase [Bosea caraganae]RDJ28419.1 GNAT family N-acetyltransferase [Bosea caraganae]